MPTKGKSNLYGRGKRGQSNEHINYKYARVLSTKHREDHVNRHGIQEMKLSNENQYKAAAISFANKVDRDNHESFVRANVITLKFSKTTGEFAAIDKEGTVTTFLRHQKNGGKVRKEKMENNQSKKTADTIICPCCGASTIIDLFDICPICGWEHNLTQLEDPDFEGGPNNLSLNQTREWFRLKRQMDPGYTWKLNAKKDGNPTLDDLHRLQEIIKEK